MNKNNFVIAGLQRTGTTLIRDTLGKHKNIFTYGEVFIFNKGKFIKRKAGEKVPYNYRKFIEASTKRKFEHYFYNEKSLNNYLDDLYENDQYSAIGFKLMLSQLKKFPKLKELLVERNIKVIHVTRENILKTLISRKLVRVRKVFHSKVELPPLKVKLNTRKLIKRLEKIQHDNQEWKNIFSKNPYVNVSYESFTNNKTKELENLFTFLDVNPDYTLTSDFKKINPNSVKDIIINYDEVCSCLKGTEYENLIQ